MTSTKIVMCFTAKKYAKLPLEVKTVQTKGKMKERSRKAIWCKVRPSTNYPMVVSSYDIVHSLGIVFFNWRYTKETTDLQL